jgi:aminocarboxymuconate-semialdehyde decarboxylase
VTAVIDAHAHVIVPEITRHRGSDDPWRPSVEWKDGRQVVHRDGTSLTSAVREFTRADVIIDAQAAAGVDRTVVSPWVALLGHELPIQEAIRVCRIQNEGLTAMVEAHPRRLSALGTLPLQDPEIAALELETLMAGSTLSGVEVGASVAGVSVGDGRFEPFWDAAEATGALVLVHPTTRGFELPVLKDHYLWNTVGNPLETTVAAAHLVVTGVLERHPGLRVLLAHGGGAALAVRGRLMHAHSFQPQARAKLTESPDDSLRRFYFDTVTHDPGLLRSLIEFASPAHVLLGSDHPFDMGQSCPADPVRGLGLASEDERMVLGGNAARLLGLS